MLSLSSAINTRLRRGPGLDSVTSTSSAERRRGRATPQVVSAPRKCAFTAGFCRTMATRASLCNEGTMPAVTEVLILDARQPDPAGIARAAGILRAGGLVAFPTETVYGLGAHALDAEAVRRVFAAKGRPAEDPLIVHVHHVDALAALTTGVPDTATALASRFWPGPLTMVLHRAGVVPREVTAGLDTVAIRVPAHPIAHALMTASAVPIAAPSANLF